MTDWVADAARRALVPLGEADVIDVYVAPLLWLSVCGILVLEYFLPARKGQKVFSLGFVQDGVYFALSAVFRVAFLAGYVALLRILYDRYMSFLTIDSVESWPLWTRVLLAILVSDFLGWFHHVVRHKVTPLWHFHAVHHSQPEMNLLTDVRVHPFDRVVCQTIRFIPLFMVDSSFPVITAWVLFHQVWTKFCHANIRMNLGPLAYVLVTPQSHRVHHSFAATHCDRNMGVVLSIWDRLFGTHYEPAPDEYPECGVVDPEFPLERDPSIRGIVRSTWQQFVYPFRQAGRSLVSSR